MSTLFVQLIDDALGEIARREPSYLERFPLTFPALAQQAEVYGRHPQFRSFSPAQIESGLEMGVEYIAEQGADVRTDSNGGDPVARFMLDSAMDAFAADRQALRLRPNTQAPRSLARILREDYDERRTPQGGRYFIRRSGERPLVLISACGIPLRIWSSFLGDHSSSFKIIVVESRTADLLLGGMRNYADLTVDGADIIAALDTEQMSQADALAWCNGGRIAIDVADRYPGRFRSLTLLSPTLRGIAGMPAQPSAFEGTMCEIFEALAQQPQLAEYFAKAFDEQSQAVNWDIVGSDPSRRAAALFGLAAKEHSRALLVPMLRPDFLVNYARRVTFDGTYPTNEALSRLDLPILLLTGDHDTIVNSTFSCAALKMWGPPIIHANVRGGGHYLQDLQYPYFLSILSDFLAARQPAASARIEVGPIVGEMPTPERRPVIASRIGDGVARAAVARAGEAFSSGAVDGIIEGLYAQVAINSSALALCDNRHALRFGDLLARTKQVHELLQSAGIVPGDRVAICSDNAVEYVIAIYGILHAGCAFVPLPFRDPEARTRRLCALAETAAIFVDGKKRVDGAGRIFDIAEAIALDRPVAAHDGNLAPRSAGKLDDATAYIIFTSGSTGEPKGVCISHQSFFCAAHEAGRLMGFGPTTKSLALLPLQFDGSFSSVFPAIMSGGGVFVNRGPMCVPAAFCNIFARHAITHTTVTPTYLQALLDSEDWSASSCETWRTLAVGGEAPSKPVLRRLREQLPRLRFFNRYGPTEATMAVSTHEISDAILSSEERIPIGTPHEGVEFVVLGSAGTPVRPGEIGELYIGGRQLMLGYLNDRSATDAVMWQSAADGQRLLKTGDLVTVNAAGQHVFIERSDNIVKRHGTRIALAEIEAALNALDSVGAAACVGMQVAESVEIVAFVQRQHSGVDERDVRRMLLRQLPASMSPDTILFVAEMPRTPNGKIDHKALRTLARREGPGTAA